jgi:transcriptional regulator with XRE-family HTH domain
MNDERHDFSRRLAEAMQAKGYPARPGVLHKLFNSHYPGRSVAFSTASKWLRGAALPEQDKLQVLAVVLGVDPQTLRFGGKPRVAEGQAGWQAAAREDEDVVMAGYRSLPQRHRRLVGELILALSAGRR